MTFKLFTFKNNISLINLNRFCIYKNETYKLKIYLSRMLEADRVFSILENSRFFSNMAYSIAD